MQRGKAPIVKPATKRTTLSLPSEFLERAEELASAQHSTVSSVIAEALKYGLPQIPSPENVDEWLASYRTAFEIPGVSEEDLLLLDGVILSPIGPDNPDPDEDES